MCSPPNRRTRRNCSRRPGSRPSRHLAQGNFRLAVTDLDAALALLQRQPQLCSFEERLTLTQLQKQTDLLGDLCAESLEEILRHAAGRQEKEWEADCRRRYHGRAFVFDCELSQERTPPPANCGRVTFSPCRRRRPASSWGTRRLASPPDRSPRGASSSGDASASIKRERPGSWAVPLEPDSVVLFTEPAGLALCCPALTDEGGLATLRRQHGWVLASRARFQAVGEK